MPTKRGTGGSAIANDLATITVANSTTPLSGDLILCFLHQNPGGSGNYDVITPPSGFAAVTSGSIQKVDWAKMSSWWKIAGGSETNSYLFTCGAAQDGMAATIIVYSNVDTLNPTPTVVTLDDTTSNTTYDIPSITTQYANSDVVAAIGNGGNGTAFGAASFASGWTNSYVEFQDICLTGEYAGVAMATQTKASPGAVGTAQATSTATDTSLAIVIEIKDAGVAGRIMRPSSGVGTGGTQNLSGGVRCASRSRIVVPPNYRRRLPRAPELRA